jgi:hypothetical protein
MGISWPVTPAKVVEHIELLATIKQLDHKGQDILVDSFGRK